MTKKSYARVVVLLCAVTYFISYLTRINYASLISAIKDARAITDVAASAVVTGSSVTYGIGQLISGYLGDKIKPVKLIFIGLLVTVLMNILLPLCPNVTLMTVVWCINGLAQAFMWPPMVKYLTQVLDREEYSSACVKVSWGSYVGIIAVYLFSPLCLMAFHKWEYMFFISAGLGLIVAFVWLYASQKLQKMSFKKADEPIVSTKTDEVPKTKMPVNSGIVFMIAFTMIAIVLQGILRDGITTWMPTYVKNTYGLSNEISILTGVVLPLYSIGFTQFTTWIYLKKIKNEHTCAALIFALATVSSVVLGIFYSSGAVVSVALSALVTGCMHAVNLVLICMIPARFEKYGNVSFMSGLLNSCTYVGSALSGFGMAAVATAFGWRATIFSWAIVAGAGALICFLMCRRWGKFISNN